MKGRRAILWGVGLCLLLACPARATAQSDWGSWHSAALKAIDTPVVDVSAFVQVRLYDASTEVRQVYVSGLVAVDAAEHLGLAGNYTYLPTRSPQTDRFLYQHRIELEANPRWRPVPRVRLEVRNRLELQWLEGREGMNQRSRHRVQATVVPVRWWRARGLFANNEFFYDWDRATYSENRLTPVGVRFSGPAYADFDVYYMVQSTRGPADWSHTHLLGTHISLAW